MNPKDIYNPAINGVIGNFTGLTSRSGGSAVQTMLTSLIGVAFGLGGIIFFIMLIRGGYEYMTAGGDKEAVQKATKRMTTAFIGISILFSVFALTLIIETLFGINLKNISFPTY